MSKIIIISDLHPPEVETFIHDVTPAQAETIIGGYSPYIYITNITDTVNINSQGDTTIEGTDSISYRENKVNTVDFSRSNYNRIFSY
ncbi:hypothetical protein [Dendronalium sp. ChiSLP03b]|uniref:hypothetical protein n=1 Tax=Dendronalium sp. ChiSLP03b TaxID=3075381 RepID=UPI002ADBC1E9|nr:hypothetical protein [Dendronalium sp. ChiSLP03b]